MNGLRVRCHAKINPSLRVLRRRADGFHELDLEFLPLALHDTLDLARADGFHLEVIGAGPEVPVADNLVLRAARALQEEVGAGRLPGARFVLRKHVPAAAGLGGGSSDAAGALLGLLRLHALGLPAERLADVALGLGSDVPYFLAGGRRRGRGRGEDLVPLPEAPVAAVVLLRPRTPLSTRDVFVRHAELVTRGSDEGAAPGQSVLTRGKTLSEAPAGRPPGGAGENDLWPAAASLMPELPDLLALLCAACPDARVGMTGSGPTLHAILPAGAPDPAAALRSAVGQGADVLSTRTLPLEEQEGSRFTDLA